MINRLPIDDALPELLRALGVANTAVVVAPPGAGKTTRVPLALLGEAWLEQRRIVVIEPRRIAARGAAERMATTTGGKVGGLVGLRMRLATLIGRETRIEVVTEGVFTRMILDDPTLEGIGALLFDEFHERSLDADLGLALGLEAQRAVRPDLRIVVMSATLDDRRLSEHLGNAPVISSAGRAHPVVTRYVGRDPSRRIEQQVADTILRAHGSEAGSILAFLPGQAEIRRAAELLGASGLPAATDLAELHGGLDLIAQARAVAPPLEGRRKIVLATSIAETSITIEGVRIVVDCGLSRVPRYEPEIGVTRLDTVRVSRASADQRRGRAGRTEPGICYRLWDEPQTAALLPFQAPEILSADLGSLTLDCAAWGATDPETLPWLDPPPQGALAAARALLESLGAIDGSGQLTDIGRRVRALPMPPRLARMLVAAAGIGCQREAALVAAVLTERGFGGDSTDLDQRLVAARQDRSDRGRRLRELADGWAEAVSVAAGRPRQDRRSARLLAFAYPDRVARARGAPGHYLLANGRAAVLDPTDPLARSPYLVVADLAGQAGAMRIRLAATLSEEDLLADHGERISERREVAFDPSSGAVRARTVRALEAITLTSTPSTVTPGPDVAEALARGAAARGVAALPWTKAQQQLRDRVGFVAAAAPDLGLPDLSDGHLAGTAASWLAPWIEGKTRLAEITADDLAAALDALVPFALRRSLELDAPTHFEAPTGRRHAISYEGPGAPILAIRVQELFGLTAHPAIARGRLPLTLHLLSPAGRPIQITRDLPGFWKGSWAAVRSEMRGRYPKHPWPEDPISAEPTARAKPRPA